MAFPCLVLFFSVVYPTFSIWWWRTGGIISFDNCERKEFVLWILDFCCCLCTEQCTWRWQVTQMRYYSRKNLTLTYGNGESCETRERQQPWRDQQLQQSILLIVLHFKYLILTSDLVIWSRLRPEMRITKLALFETICRLSLIDPQVAFFVIIKLVFNILLAVNLLKI